MRGPFVLLSTLSFVMLTGCERGASQATPDASQAAPPTPASAAPTEAMRAGPEDGGAHGVGDPKRESVSTRCPSSAPGATASVEDVPGGVAVTVTGATEDTTKEIRERTKRLLDADRTEADAGVHHDGRGSAHGRYGRCVVVMKDTELASKDVPGGVRLTVKAKDAAEVTWLRKETRDRGREAHAKDGGS